MNRDNSRWAKTTVLNARQPEDWLRRIEGIRDGLLRCVVANIVWWDFFAGRKVANRWPQLNRYMDQWKLNFGVGRGRVKYQLIKLGYSAAMANIRLKTYMNPGGY